MASVQSRNWEFLPSTQNGAANDEYAATALGELTETEDINGAPPQTKEMKLFEIYKKFCYNIYIVKKKKMPHDWFCKILW